MGRFISATVALTPIPSRVLQVCGSTGGQCCLFTVPANVTTVTFEIWGGGGAGGPKCCCYCGASSGGGSGAYAIKTIATSAGAQFTLCAGAGGEKRYCSVSGSNVGCAGGTSYVTGGTLSNFCATGGQGGYTVCCQQNHICWGGQAYGGDFTFFGDSGWQHGGCSYSYICHMSGGAAAIWGGKSVHASSHCCPYMTHGIDGIFPGGGGTGFAACCCECCACNGAGGSGLVKVTY